MKFADRLKVTAAAMSSTTLAVNTTITMGAAAMGCRTLAQAIATGEISVGDTNIPFIVDDGAGNWQSAFFTITSSTVITCTKLINGSNGTSSATFSGALPSVFNSAPASILNAGLINPHDPGFDIIICAGQSNMVGQDTPSTSMDIADPRVFSFGGYSVETATYQKIAQAVDPLRYNYSQASLPSLGNGSGLSPAQWFAKTYAGMIPSNRKVLLVPVARSATYLVAQTAEWSPGDGVTGGGFLYENAISQANAALTAAQKMYPNSRVVGTIWLQGESDASWTVSQINYAAALKTLIQGFRSRITGASNSWFITMGMIGEYVANTAAGASAAYGVIDQAHQQVCNEFPRCAYTPGLTGYAFAASPVHYSADGARIMGCNAASVLPQAILSKGSDATAPTVLRASVSSTATSTVAVTLSEPFDPAYPPQSSAWTVTGHTVTAASGQGNVVYLTVSTPFVGGEATRTVTFTASGNGIRDLAGNLMATQSPVNITNNAPANATGTTLTGPTSGTAAIASTAFTVGVTPVGSNITGTVVVTPSDAGAGGTFTPATVSLTSASPTGTFTYTAAAAGTVTISTTNNGSLTNPASITYTVAAADTTPPTFSSAQVANASPTVVQLTMSEALGASVPPTSAFSITENGTAKTVSSVSVSGSIVSVTVSAAFTNATTIQATYTQPGADPRIKDVAGNLAASFGPVAVTNNVAASNGTDIRFADLYTMTETSAVAPYAYKENSGVNYTATNNGGTSLLKASGDFTFITTISSVVSGQQMVALKTASTTTTYSNTLCNLMAKTSGYAAYAGSVTAPTVANSTTIPADGDQVKLVRTGTSVAAYVSKDTGATWTLILTWPTVSGILYVQILSASNGVFTAPNGIGFA